MPQTIQHHPPFQSLSQLCRSEAALLESGKLEDTYTFLVIPTCHRKIFPMSVLVSVFGMTGLGSLDPFVSITVPYQAYR